MAGGAAHKANGSADIRCGGIVLNAIVTGALSGPYDRYLARIIWLILFVGLVSICCIMRVYTHKQVFKGHR
jgi:hypothetical protein